MTDHAFRVELEHVQRDDGGTDGYYRLAGERRGPFATPDALEADLLERLGAWNARARELGGWAWRRSTLELVVTVPEGVPVDGGEPLTPWVASRRT